MSNDNGVQTFRGKPISDLDAFEFEAFKDACRGYVGEMLRPSPGGRLAIDPKGIKPDLYLHQSEKMPKGYRWF